MDIAFEGLDLEQELTCVYARRVGGLYSVCLCTPDKGGVQSSWWLILESSSGEWTITDPH